MGDLRKNDLLDEFLAENDGKPPAKRRKRRTAGLNRDSIKRRAFRILAVIADLPANERKRVLRMAEKLSGA